MADFFDVIVIGTGPAGSSIAIRCSEQGLQVAAVESEEFGGTCPLHGCIPKKVLSHTTSLLKQLKQLEGRGIDAKGKINWPDLIRFKQSFTDPAPKEKKKAMNDAGITTLHGQASFVSEQEVQVGDRMLHADKIVIATGAKPSTIPIDGVQYLTHSDAFLEMTNLPERITFVGGGYISFEFAHMAAIAGSKVDIIESSDRALTGFDPDLVEQLIQLSETMHIQVHLHTKVQSIEKKGNTYKVIGEKNGEKIFFESDVVIHGAGRTPHIEKLKLNNGNIAHDEKGITVNSFLQSTSNSHVYAAGDVANTDGIPLTPVANLEAGAVITNILTGNQKKLNYKGIPSVAFTSPKIATVGMSEKEAREFNANVKINDVDMTDWFTYKQGNESYAAVKVITDETSGHVLGAHILSNEADELINYFAMAMQLHLTVEDIRKVTYVFPTATSDIRSMLKMTD